MFILPFFSPSFSFSPPNSVELCWLVSRHFTFSSLIPSVLGSRLHIGWFLVLFTWLPIIFPFCLIFTTIHRYPHWSTFIFFLVSCIWYTYLVGSYCLLSCLFSIFPLSICLYVGSEYLYLHHTFSITLGASWISVFLFLLYFKLFLAASWNENLFCRPGLPPTFLVAKTSNILL